MPFACHRASSAICAGVAGGSDPSPSTALFSSSCARRMASWRGTATMEPRLSFFDPRAEVEAPPPSLLRTSRRYARVHTSSVSARGGLPSFSSSRLSRQLAIWFLASSIRAARCAFRSVPGGSASGRRFRTSRASTGVPACARAERMSRATIQEEPRGCLTVNPVLMARDGTEVLK